MARIEEDIGNKAKGLAIMLIILMVIVLLATSSVKIVDAGHRGVLLSLGKVEPNILDEGLHFVTPFVQDVKLMTVQTQLYSTEASAASKDLQDVSTKIAVNYHIDSGRVAEIYQKYTMLYEGNIIQPAVQESTKAVTALFTAEELITKRPEVKEKIELALRDRLDDYGIIVETTSITDFRFSSSFTSSIEAKVVATQNALKAENDLRRIEVEARQKIAQASGDANATLTRAMAEAEAIRIQGIALKENPSLVSLKIAEAWSGELPKIVMGSSTPFIDISSILETK